MTITDTMVERAARACSETWYAMDWDKMMPGYKAEFLAAMRKGLEAALEGR